MQGPLVFRVFQCFTVSHQFMAFKGTQCDYNLGFHVVNVLQI